METGCKRWKDCFTCPFSDCKWGDTQELRNFSYYQNYASKNKEKIRAYKKKYYDTHKGELKAKAKARREARKAKEEEVWMGSKESIIHTENTESCYLCGQYATDRHHVIHGTANRKLADKDGLTVMLCHSCHMKLHDKGNFDKELQKIGQKAWMEYYGKTANEFRKRYGKNYL